MIRKKELAAAHRESKDSAMGSTAEVEVKELEAAMHAAEAEVEAEMRATGERYRVLEEGLVSGFKKRCLFEAKSAKEKGRALSEVEKRECYQSAAEAVKARYERDQKALLESLEAERAKQRKKMLRTLASKKNKIVDSASGSGSKLSSALRALELEAKAQLQRLNESFDEQAAAAIAKPQVSITSCRQNAYTVISSK
jgi:hypothetical protein